jgi:hypothetical protein
MIIQEQPLLVTSSPPCTTFCPLRRLSNHKRDAQIVAEEEELGKERLRKALKACVLQASTGNYFLHEHPKDSWSWKMPEVKELVDSGKYYLVQSPMCRFGMKLKDDNGEEQYVRKETLWLTNSEAIANELRGVCDNVLHGQEIHWHVKLIGGQRAKAAQVYPKALVEAILRGLQKEVRRTKKISMVEEMISGPSPDDAVEWDMD